jgi:hypothetical protein
MLVCPYYRKHPCSAYLEDTREISEQLADRIEDHYCNGDYRTCSRYKAAEEGTLSSRQDLAPWSEPRSARWGIYETETPIRNRAEK